MLTQEKVHQSRWGYHPCDYETYKKLKTLYKYAWKAVYMEAEWKRWERKLPHNRVIRRKIRNAARQVIGFQPPVPRPEPPRCSVFNDKLIRKVFDNFWNAGHPVAKPEDVTQLTFTAEEINELYDKFAK